MAKRFPGLRLLPMVLAFALAGACFPDQPFVASTDVLVSFECAGGLHNIDVSLSENADRVLLARLDFFGENGDLDWAVYLDLAHEDGGAQVAQSLRGLENPDGLGLCASRVELHLMDEGGQQTVLPR